MAAKARMLFRDMDGSPVPLKPTDGRGTPIAPNGKTILSIDQAARHFDTDRLALALLYHRVMLPTLGPKLLSEMMIEEGGVG